MIQRIFFLLALLVASAANAQHPLIEVDVASDTLRGNYGQNKLHYVHFNSGLGFVASEPEGDSLALTYGMSYQAFSGFRYKLRLTNWLATGLDLNYVNTRYRIAQDSAKNVPSTHLYDRESLVRHAVNGGVYVRFNVGKRGNVIGKYLDLAGFGSYSFAHRHRTLQRFDEPNADGAKVSRAVNRNLSYVNRVNYGVKARLGMHGFAVYASYRLSDVLNGARYGELPRLMVGIEIAGLN